MNSMSDLFHDAVPVEFIARVFDVMRRAERHTFQVLTKRSERLREVSPHLPWPKNVWMGVSVEDRRYRSRVDDLREVPARVRFLSLEPLLGPLEGLDLAGISWVIVGGESGPGARPMDPSWVRRIRDQCGARQIPFCFKQWGGTNKKKTGRVIDGRTWDEMPGSYSSRAHDNRSRHETVVECREDLLRFDTRQADAAEAFLAKQRHAMGFS